MISSANATSRYSRTLAGPTNGHQVRVRADVFGKAEAELLALQTDFAESASSTEQSSDSALRTAEKEFLARRFALDTGRVFMLQQVHGDRALEIQSRDITKRESRTFFDEGDALFTRERGVLLAIRTADCLPIFFDLSLETGTLENAAGARETDTVVGVIHAGWRGLAAGIVSRSLTAALTALNGGPKNADDPRAHDDGPARLRARFFFGPCIGPEAYEVGDEVARHFTHKRRISNSEKYLLDLRANARLEIEGALHLHARDLNLAPETVARDCIIVAQPDFDACTYQANTDFFSHRRGDRGRNLNTIWIEE